MKLVVIPPCGTYGDIMSIIALVYFFVNKYNKVYIFIENKPIIDYYNHYFSVKTNINKKIKIISFKDINLIIKNKDNISICNTYTGTWKGIDKDYKFYDLIKNKGNYYSDRNPIYNAKIDINIEYICKPNLRLPLKEVEINSIVYYKMIGLNNNVRMNFFHYERDIQKENEIKKEIYTKYNLKNGDKYNIINTIGSQGETIDENRINNKINNKYPSIDINYLVDFPGWLLLLIEEAESIHLVEGCNTNFIYYCQYKNIMKRKEVYFHIWARNRSWKSYKLDNSWKMMANPKLEEWNFIFKE